MPCHKSILRIEFVSATDFRYLNQLTFDLDEKRCPG